jgi:hypothetical protein
MHRRRRGFWADFLSGLKREPERPEPIASGEVAQIGGGVVLIVLDRDTMTYPEVGTRVALYPTNA